MVHCGRLLVDDFCEAEVEISQLPVTQLGRLNGDEELACDVLRDWIYILQREYLNRRSKLWAWIDANEPAMSENDRHKLPMVKARHRRPTAEEIETELAWGAPPVRLVKKRRAPARDSV